MKPRVADVTRSCWHEVPVQEAPLVWGAAAFRSWRIPVLRQRRAAAVAVAGGSPAAAPRCCDEPQLEWLLKIKEEEDFR